MIIWGAVNNSSEEQGVSQKSLDGFDEKGREVPCVGKRRSESLCMLEICIEGRRLREVVQVFEGSWMSRDVPFVRRF